MTFNRLAIGLVGLVATSCLPAFGAVKILSLRPSLATPQPIGTNITWTAKATDSGAGPLTFQFSVRAPGHAQFSMVKDFNVGTLSGRRWTSQPFVLPLTGVEGVYGVQVVVKDFGTGQTATSSVAFRANPIVTGSTPVVVPTPHPLVAVFSAPSCPAGSNMRVSFQQTSMATPATYTNWMPCNPPNTMTFEIGGMYPSTDYQMFAQTETGGSMSNSATVNFTTGAIPSTVSYITGYSGKPMIGPNADTTDNMLLLSIAAPGTAHHNPPADEALDLNGNVMWYYNNNSSANLIRRPLAGGTFLSTEDGLSWFSGSKQLLRQVDLEGNIVKETNIGVLQQQLLKLGYADAGPCTTIPIPAPVGSACMGSFHHDAIQTLPRGYTAAIVDIEKVYPAGTQGDTTGLPVDIIGDGIVVLDQNWQAVWFFDVFDHATGGHQLDINRPAVLGETCAIGQGGCPTLFLAKGGVTPRAHDWLHVNTVYYWPKNGDLLFSSRHQDWVMRVDYSGKTGNILWRLGPNGDFAMNNVNQDPWPWNSHQHDIGFESNGYMDMFDNGNTRISPPSGNGSSTGGTPGLGGACVPNDCQSRGMVLNVDETTMTVTPILSQSLPVYSGGDGSAQLLSNGNYFFVAGIVINGPNTTNSNSIEIMPAGGSAVTGSIQLNLQAPESYRGWQLQSLYAPPIT